MGIRMALGARKGDVLALVLGESARIAVVGIVIGFAGSFYLNTIVIKAAV